MIAVIDTEAKGAAAAASAAPKAHRAASRAAPRSRAGTGRSAAPLRTSPALPAARKMMAEQGVDRRDRSKARDAAAASPRAT